MKDYTVPIAIQTDYNIRIAKEFPRAEIERLDFLAQEDKENLLGGIQA